MGDVELALALVADIYDAALEPDLWPTVLAGISRFLDCAAGGLFFRDAAHRTGNIVYEVGADPYYTRLYFDEYIKLDPLSEAYLVIDVGDVFSSSTIIPPNELSQSRFYKEWIQPQGWIDNICVTLEKSPTTLAGAAFFRDQRAGLADEAARERLSLLVAHLRRAILIGKLIDLKAGEAATLVDTLDALRTATFLLGADGRILHANAAGHSFVAKGDVIRADGDRLAACDPNTAQNLRRALTAAGVGDIAMGAKGIAIPLVAQDGERHVAHVLPLARGPRRRGSHSYGAAAALFVQKAALEIPSPPEIIAKTYSLTPTELRVLLAIVEIGGVPEVASTLGIAETTVKTHLSRLFEKTNTSRQADLIKLVAGFSNPLLP